MPSSRSCLSGDHKCQLWIQLAGTTLLLLLLRLLRSLRGWESHNQHWCTAAIIGLSCWQHGQWGCYFPLSTSCRRLSDSAGILTFSAGHNNRNDNHHHINGQSSRQLQCGQPVTTLSLPLKFDSPQTLSRPAKICLLGLYAREVGSTKRRPLSRMSNSLFSLCRQRY